MSNTAKPKQLRIVEGIIQAIADGNMKVGEPLPSVNRLMERWGVARMTVVRAIEELKSRGIVESKSSVGNFIRGENTNLHTRIMLFLSHFDAYNEIMYREIIQGLDLKNMTVNIFFHHYDPDIFRMIIKENIRLYSLYIVTPFEHSAVKSALDELPKHRLLQLSRPPVISGTSYISQNFYEGLKLSLEQLKDKIRKYKSIKLIFSKNSKHPIGIPKAFTEFCENNHIHYCIESEVQKSMISEGVIFFTIDDNNLIAAIKLSEEMGFHIGNEIGVISYNDTPMKEILRSGVTVISADFKWMGQEVHRFIETRKIICKTVPTNAIIRYSL